MSLCLIVNLIELTKDVSAFRPNFSNEQWDWQFLYQPDFYHCFSSPKIQKSISCNGKNNELIDLFSIRHPKKFFAQHIFRKLTGVSVILLQLRKTSKKKYSLCSQSFWDGNSEKLLKTIRIFFLMPPSLLPENLSVPQNFSTEYPPQK